MNDRLHTPPGPRNIGEPARTCRTSQLQRTRSGRFSFAGKLGLGLLFLVMGLVSGCTHSYVMRLQNGMQLTTASKPKLKNGVYVYKDALGREQYVPAGSVREIEPASMAQEQQTKFKPSSK